MWLAIRIVNRRERWAKRALAVLTCVPVLYVLSFGPACWLANRGMLNHLRIADVYSPLVSYSGHYLTNKTAAALRWYGTLFAEDQSDGTLNVMELYLCLAEMTPAVRQRLGYDERRWAETTCSPLFPAKNASRSP